MSHLATPAIPVLFHQLPISAEPFLWRGRSWIKTSQHHATLIGGSLNENIPEHIPSHDVVELLEAPP